jgi:multicomponent Na+:H+ antiporter subunit A
MVVGAWRAVQETDLKRILAYSTASALGVLTMLLGVGTREAVVAALVYLVAHAGYKGALFLVAGAIDHETGNRDIAQLGGLRRAMPLTAAAGGMAALSMAGVPLTLGFLGKDGAYEALFHGGVWQAWLLALMVLASILLGMAGLLAGVLPFRGSPAEGAAHEPRVGLWLPPLALGLGGVIAGAFPAVLDALASAAATAILQVPSAVSLAPWHGLSPALALSALTLLSAVAAYSLRDAIRRRAWRPALGAESLYAGALSALFTASRLVAPPLHSGSLRSYVMVILAVTIAVAGAALVTASGMSVHADLPVTSVRPHELLVTMAIITGAVAATRARSTMAAVLSLGTVGYGVATTFLLFGAPDLAMTQFSVETLTVLIYVLVFRHFRELGPLSPRLVRWRDACIAAGGGTLIGALVLRIATTETPPDLRSYFVELGPTLGHGRNIVNVILVDFRAFDTLGEITVLATAAVGVRALLRMAGGATAGRDAGEGQPPSPIFRTAVRLLMPLLLLFSVFLLVRGHNEPGGGFVAGLVAAAAFALYTISRGVESARRALLVDPATLLGAGLLIALASGLFAVLRGEAFLTAQWTLGSVAAGTPMLFDVGVFLVVAGVVLMMVFSLAEEA